MGTGRTFFGGRVERQGREADRSLTTSAEVKKTSIYTSTPPYANMAYRVISCTQGRHLLLPQPPSTYHHHYYYYHHHHYYYYYYYHYYYHYHYYYY
jgi:hypothetical protein